MKKIMIFGEDSFFQFRVHLDPIFIKKSRFHALQQEKLVTKVILLSLSWTMVQVTFAACTEPRSAAFGGARPKNRKNSIKEREKHEKQAKIDEIRKKMKNVHFLKM